MKMVVQIQLIVFQLKDGQSFHYIRSKIIITIT